MSNCFPDWLQRLNKQSIGPPIEDLIPYPTFLVQPGVISQDNPNSRAATIADSFFQSYSDLIPTSSHGPATTIIHICPNNLYDTILITAIDSSAWLNNGSGGVHGKPVPIFLSFDRPGRITSETALTPEVLKAAANRFNSNSQSLTYTPQDVSSLPNAMSVSQMGTAVDSWNPYSTLQFNTPKTNRPFYVWFADDIFSDAAGAVAYKISWFTIAR